MKKIFVSILLGSVLSLSAVSAVPAAPASELGVNWVMNAQRALGVQAKIAEFDRGPGWIRVQVKVFDERYPLTVDILADVTRRPEKIIYLLPGSGLNFKAAFFSPKAENLAQFFRKAGYLVIGITPRESSVPPETEDLSFMAGWGAKKHKQDIRKIVRAVGSVLPLKYDMLGHSIGGGYAIDYAATYTDKLDKVIVVDLPSFDPAYQKEAIGFAFDSYNALNRLLHLQVYADDSNAMFKTLSELAVVAPNVDSGESRGEAPGNFTFAGLFHFSCIYTGLLPGLQTPFTGRPDNWDLVQGYINGSYEFAIDPVKDKFSLTHTSANRLANIAANIEGGLWPLADARDFAAQVCSVWGGYSYKWHKVNERVLWVNSELGYGRNQYGAELIRRSGNRQVRTVVIPNYAHADLLWGKNAKVDVWPVFLPQHY